MRNWLALFLILTASPAYCQTTSPTNSARSGEQQSNPATNSSARDTKSARSQVPSAQGQSTDLYQTQLQRRIKRNWFPPKGQEGNRIVVEFKVHKAGELSDLRLIDKSESTISNQAALKAVENAAPFRPLPDGSPDPITVQFTFDHNVFSGGGGNAVIR